MSYCRFQRAVQTSIYIPRPDIQCGCVEADLCLAMQKWGLKLEARLESWEAFAAKLVIPTEMLSQAHGMLINCGPIFLFPVSGRM